MSTRSDEIHAGDTVRYRGRPQLHDVIAVGTDEILIQPIGESMVKRLRVKRVECAKVIPAHAAPVDVETIPLQ